MVYLNLTEEKNIKFEILKIIRIDLEHMTSPSKSHTIYYSFSQLSQIDDKNHLTIQYFSLEQYQKYLQLIILSLCEFN